MANYDSILQLRWEHLSFARSIFKERTLLMYYEPFFERGSTVNAKLRCSRCVRSQTEQLQT
ncbi:MAG: hypothetical protein EAZ60_16260 [Oscillatoriales cyanobacterium]|nr:MAG: hypothetical protein EAZ79_26720 [Oscillatoriales cyanobacterium]TAF54567.1 MAG: hypothetical protein EAZ60_16260 [Oscillatoriales cyanobacterium]TAG71025.1 MAG: hypothetical protein EAZ23_20310 [Oscillatoriales cyanobacterium]